MAISPYKTWISGEVLTASDLNASFSYITSNAMALISPLTSALDLNGLELILDADADTSITADTDDRIDFKLAGADLFIMDGTTASAVNGLTATFSATGNRPRLSAHGSDTNIGLSLRPKGTGSGASVIIEDGNGNEVLIAGVATASAVNEVTVTNAATGNRPVVSATGGDTDIGLELKPKGAGIVQISDGNGNEVLKTAAAVSSAVNELTVTNAATGTNPKLSATGGDTNVGLELIPKGTGRVTLTDGTDATKKVAVDASALTTATTRTLTVRDANFTLGAATQAEMETGTSTEVPVVPGRQHFHPGHPKAWCNFNGTGSVALRASYNVSGVVDNGTGDYAVTLDTDLSSTNAAAFATCEMSSARGGRIASAYVSAVGTVLVTTTNVTPVVIDKDQVSVSVFGDI